jgi:hypothetical protein
LTFAQHLSGRRAGVQQVVRSMAVRVFVNPGLR